MLLAQLQLALSACSSWCRCCSSSEPARTSSSNNSAAMACNAAIGPASSTSCPPSTYGAPGQQDGAGAHGGLADWFGLRSSRTCDGPGPAPAGSRGASSTRTRAPAPVVDLEAAQDGAHQGVGRAQAPLRRESLPDTHERLLHQVLALGMVDAHLVGGAFDLLEKGGPGLAHGSRVDPRGPALLLLILKASAGSHAAGNSSSSISWPSGSATKTCRAPSGRSRSPECSRASPVRCAAMSSRSSTSRE